MPTLNKFLNPRQCLFGALLVLAVLASYSPVWRAGFVWDDDMYVTQNKLLTAPDGLRRIWFSRDAPSQYFPLTYTVFRVERSLWGLAPAGYHVVNVLLHALNTLLLWRLLRRLEIPGHWFGAAIFALHPVNVESVAWISELKNILSLLFYLLAMRSWVECLESNQTHPARYYILTLVAAVLALASKTTACTLPAALLLLLWFQRQPLTAKRCLQIAPFFLLSAAMATLAIWWERFHQNTVGAAFQIAWLERFLIACRGLWFYPGKLLWPTNLAFIYPKWQIDPRDPLVWIWPAATLLLTLVLILRRRFLPHGVLIALLFYVAALGPLLGFIMEYTFRYTFVADHYQYIAAIAPCALVATFLNRPSLAVLRIILLVTLAILTWRQSSIYHNSETLWRANIARNPNAAISHNNLAAALIDRADFSGALAESKIALTLDPDDANAENDFGFATLRLGDASHAIPRLERAATLDPGNPNPPFNLGHAALTAKDYAAAANYFARAAALKPDFAEAQCNLGFSLLQLGRIPEAFAAYESALNSDPDYFLAHNDLGVIYLRQHDLENALVHFQRAVALSPSFFDARCNLGDTLLALGRRDEAGSQYKEALKLQPNSPSVLARLAQLGLTQQQPQ